LEATDLAQGDLDSSLPQVPAYEVESFFAVAEDGFEVVVLEAEQIDVR
jgi:hypothetical protein